MNPHIASPDSEFIPKGVASFIALARGEDAEDQLAPLLAVDDSDGFQALHSYLEEAVQAAGDASDFRKMIEWASLGMLHLASEKSGIADMPDLVIELFPYFLDFEELWEEHLNTKDFLRVASKLESGWPEPATNLRELLALYALARTAEELPELEGTTFSDMVTMQLASLRF